MAVVESEKKYFTQVPNFIDEIGLSPLAYCLYVHYARVCFEQAVTKEGVRELAKKFKCGFVAIKKAKAELEKENLIAIQTFPAADNRPDEVRLVDIWQRNSDHFQPEPVSNQQQGSDDLLPDSNSPVSNEKHPVSNQQQYKEEDLKPDSKKEKKTKNIAETSSAESREKKFFRKALTEFQKAYAAPVNQKQAIAQNNAINKLFELARGDTAICFQIHLSQRTEGWRKGVVNWNTVLDRFNYYGKNNGSIKQNNSSTGSRNDERIDNTDAAIEQLLRQAGVIPGEFDEANQNNNYPC